MNPSLLSTASDDRRDPAIALDLMSRLVSVSLATKRCDEPRRQHWPDTRERPYEFVVRVFTSKRINFVIIDSDSSDKLLQQTGPRHNSGTAGGKYRHIGSRWNGLPNLLQTARYAFGFATIVVDKEAFDRSRPGPLQLVEIGPTF